jgi:hypothetical protein
MARWAKKHIIMFIQYKFEPIMFQPNLAWMVLRWSPFKIVSGSSILYPRWLPLLKIQIMSNGQNGSFRQSLVEIGQVVSDKKIFKLFFAYLCLICIIGQNRQKFKLNTLLYAPFIKRNYFYCKMLLKIEITSNGQNCCIWSHDELKFELY